MVTPAKTQRQIDSFNQFERCLKQWVCNTCSSRFCKVCLEKSKVL